MAFLKRGVTVETIVFNGKRYNRYPESTNPAHMRYFARSGARLHRDVWIFHNGPIPEGMHIHHIDGDTANNDISNLACISRKEHWQLHEHEISARSKTPEHLQHLDRIRPQAAGWHKSEAGKEWHRKHAQESLAKTWGKPRDLPDVAIQCVWCGTSVTGKSKRRLFCTSTCQNAESKFRLGKSRYQHPYHAARLRPDG